MCFFSASFADVMNIFDTPGSAKWTNFTHPAFHKSAIVYNALGYEGMAQELVPGTILLYFPRT